MKTTQASVGFARVKQILDRLVEGREETLLFIHSDAFGWSDKAALTNAAARPFNAGPVYSLIDPALVGVGRARETNLYKALTTGIAGYEQMPFGGPYATEEELEAIATWIDAGMPE